MFKHIAYTKNEATRWPIPNYWDALALLAVISFLIIISWGAQQMVAPFHLGQEVAISLDPRHLPAYALRTVFRLFIALGFSLLFTFVVGTVAARSKRAERIIVPIIDILQSVPVLGFLTIFTPFFIAVFHGSMLGPECAAIFVVFTSQVWNMVLSFYQSMRTVPHDMQEAAAIFRLSKWQKFWRIEVPHAMPGLLWNMMMSMSGSWFFITLSEAFPIGGHNFTLPGIGSYISVAVAGANVTAIIYAFICMLIVIFLYDQIFFRPLVYWSEKFKGEQEEEGRSTATSLVVTLFQNTRFLRYSGVWLSYLSDWFINPPFGWRKERFSHEQGFLKESTKKYLIVFYYIGLALALFAASAAVIYFLMHIVKTLGWGELRKVGILGLFTAARVMVLVGVASLIWVPVGVWIGLRPSLAAKVQPLVQFLAAFPANLLFPVVAFLFLKYKMNVEIWVAPLMVLGTQWYILFNVIAGASALPKDIKQVAALLRVKGWLRWQRLLLPGIAPYFITGAITAAGGAWNASIVAEVIAWHNTKLEATGLGAYITDSFGSNSTAQIILGIITMCVLVLIINRIFWRPLYNMAVKRCTLE